MSSRAKDTGFLRNLITYDGSGNITLPALLYILGNKEVATKEYVDAQNSGQVLQSRTLTINGVTYDLSSNRSWTIDSMVYPSAGIALSSGTGWGTSITNNSSNWNTAYGWGNHALAGYLTSFTETDPIWIADKPNYATKTYVNTSISNLIDSAPTTLDTLNELAAALGDDPNFATSITTLIGTKEPVIAAGTTAQYWRGDKTWQTLPTYSLPIASATVLGGIKVGTNLSIDANGVLSSTDTNTTYGNFTRTVAGLVPNPGGSSTTRYLREDGTWVIPPDTDTNTWNANTKDVAGYVAAPGAVANKVWKTDGSGNPAWRDDADTVVTSLAWTSITGRPTALSQFTNDLGNYGGWITSAGTAAAVSQTIAADSAGNLVYAQMADNDFFRIRVGGASNGGWAEIATADDGTEPIYVRQYSGVFSTVTRTATLLDGSGNTTFPGVVTASSFSGITYWTSVSGRPTHLSQLTNDLGNYGNWLVRSGDSMTGRLTIDTRNANDNLPLHVLSVEPYIQLQATGASNSTSFKMYPTGGFTASIGNYATGELCLVAANSEAVFINSNSIRVNKYRFNGNGSLSGNGTPEIVDMATVGMAMQSLNYRWYNNNASAILMSLTSAGNLTANAFFESSDIRYKNVIETNPEISGLGIDVIKFTRHGSDIVRYGYSAQQVQALIPEVVEGKEMLTVNYMDVHTLKIASLERRVKELEERLKSTL